MHPAITGVTATGTTAMMHNASYCTTAAMMDTSRIAATICNPASIAALSVGFCHASSLSSRRVCQREPYDFPRIPATCSPAVSFGIRTFAA